MKQLSRKLLAGEIVKRDTDQVGVLIKESEFHKGYWKVLSGGEVQEWFIGNFNVFENIQKQDIRENETL